MSDEEIATVARIGGPKAATYGEITPRGFASLAMRLGLGPETHFADLGSGCGQATLQAAAQFGVASACGVELAPSRHAQAVAALEVVPEEVARRVTFVLGDIASAELWAANGPMHETTDVYTCSLCLSTELMGRLASRIERSAAIRRVASLRPFDTLRGFKEDGAPEPCEMSWSVPEPGDSEWDHRGVPVHIYVRQD